jgi:hypothetical protein
MHGLIFDGGCEDVVEVGAVSQRIECLLDLITVKNDLLLYIFETVLAAL